MYKGSTAGRQHGHKYRYTAHFKIDALSCASNQAGLSPADACKQHFSIRCSCGHDYAAADLMESMSQQPSVTAPYDDTAIASGNSLLDKSKLIIGGRYDAMRADSVCTVPHFEV